MDDLRPCRASAGITANTTTSSKANMTALVIVLPVMLGKGADLPLASCAANQPLINRLFACREESPPHPSVNNGSSKSDMYGVWRWKSAPRLLVTLRRVHFRTRLHLSADAWSCQFQLWVEMPSTTSTTTYV